MRILSRAARSAVPGLDQTLEVPDDDFDVVLHGVVELDPLADVVLELERRSLESRDPLVPELLDVVEASIRSPVRTVCDRDVHLREEMDSRRVELRLVVLDATLEVLDDEANDPNVRLAEGLDRGVLVAESDRLTGIPEQTLQPLAVLQREVANGVSVVDCNGEKALGLFNRLRERDRLRRLLPFHGNVILRTKCKTSASLNEGMGVVTKITS